jgi:hypothetical protein
VDVCNLLPFGFWPREWRRNAADDRKSFPDGRFAFRNTGDSESEKQTYDLIDKGSGKVLKSVAESDPDLGPSARFNMKVLWRPDSKAFAVSAELIKLGSEVSV